jgi:CHAD domain-containing protein
MAKTPTQKLSEAAREPDVQRAAVAAAALTGAAAAGGKLVADRAARRQRHERRFRLRLGQALDDDLRRVVRGRIDDALDHLQGRHHEDAATAVHEARKALKRARAVVRIARYELGDEVYRRENAAYREAGRRLSAARDAEVVVETLDDVTSRYADELRPNGDEHLHERLETEREEARTKLEADDSQRAQASADLEEARARVATWMLVDDVAPVTTGLRRIYRLGRRRMRAARKDPSVERLHEWRKRVKDLWHADELLRPAKPKRMRRWARDAHRLSDLLGEDHDLAVLRQRVAAPDLRAVIDRRRTDLQAEAFALGARIYGRRPRALAHRVEAWWRRRVAKLA